MRKSSFLTIGVLTIELPFLSLSILIISCIMADNFSNIAVDLTLNVTIIKAVSFKLIKYVVKFNVSYKL